MNKVQPIGLFIVLLGVAVVGYAWISAIALKTTAPSEIVTDNQSLQRRGVVEHIEPNARFLILKSMTLYAENYVSQYKIHVTDQTKIERSLIATENDIIYYEGLPTPSDISQIKVGDEILIIILVADRKLTALYIRHGIPLPGI